MSRRRRKPPSAQVIDFVAALKRREESQNTALEREEPMSFLQFSFSEPVTVKGEVLEVVIDRYEGFGLSIKPKDALALAKSLRAAARSAMRKGAG